MRRVINASKVLTDGEKRVWIEDQELDNGPEGSYLEHAQLAARLGYTGDSVKMIRSRLVAHRLQVTFERPGVKGKVTRRCTALPNTTPAERPSPNEIVLLVAELDSQLRVNAGLRVGSGS